MKAGSLFSGIEGIGLGLERAGMEVIWQSEIDPFACRVLAKHWPKVPNLGDITTVDWSLVPRADLVAGGFPCQDLSSAHTNGKRKDLDGDKSGLWREFRRCLAELAPRFVLVENVAQWKAWVPQVRADLSDLGYASVPVVLHAGTFGAPHKRARCFVVADSHGNGESVGAIHEEASRLRPLPIRSGYWGQAEPCHVRVDDGAADRVDRLRACGNAVVPQVAEWLGHQIMAIAAAAEDGEVAA